MGGQKHHQRHEQPTNSVRRSIKRKLEDEFIITNNITSSSSDDVTISLYLVNQVTLQVQILESEQDDEDDDDYRLVV